MGAYPFILRLFVPYFRFNCIMVISMLYVIKRLYGADRGHRGALYAIAYEKACYVLAV